MAVGVRSVLVLSAANYVRPGSVWRAQVRVGWDQNGVGSRRAKREQGPHVALGHQALPSQTVLEPHSVTTDLACNDNGV